MKNNKCIILVTSWDGAEELWTPFANAINKFWEHCPFKIYLITQTKIPTIKLFDKVIRSPEKYTSNRLQKALPIIDSKYILSIADDFFINEYVNTDKILQTLDMMDKFSLDYLKFYNGGTNNFIFSFGPSIIKRDVFLEFANKSPNKYAREFEINVNKIMSCEKKYNVQQYKYVFTNHCVLEGYWIWSSYKWCKKNGIALTFKTYHKPNVFHSIYSFLKAFLFNFILKFFPNIYKAYSQKKYCK